MTIGNLVSDATAVRLQQLLGDGGTTAGASTSDKGGRQRGYVRILSRTGAGEYVGQYTVYREADSSWLSFADCIVLTSNAEVEALNARENRLVVGYRYLAERFGTRSDGTTVWVADTATALGCGLTQDFNGNISLYTPSIAGDGLTYTYPVEDTEALDCQLKVYTGCGLTIEEDTRKVKVLAGCGMECTEEGGITVDQTIDHYDEEIVLRDYLPVWGGCQVQNYWTFYKYRNYYNSCGLLIYRAQVGTETRESTVYVPCCCSYSELEADPPLEGLSVQGDMIYDDETGEWSNG